MLNNNASLKIIDSGESGRVAALTETENYIFDIQNATLVIDAGTYTVIFADYEGKKLVNVEYTTVTFTDERKGTIQDAFITKEFSLAAGDKIMLWSDMPNLVPLCEAYIVK